MNGWTDEQRAERWAQRFECPHLDSHDCLPCPACGVEEHRFGDEPYCDVCAMPHPGFFGHMKALLGLPLSDHESRAIGALRRRRMNREDEDIGESYGA